MRLHLLVIDLSLLLGLILMILPLPDWIQIYRPNWVALMLVYWSMALPKRAGLWLAFCVGLLVDTLLGTLLGQHTLGLVVTIALSLNLYQRIRVLSLITQSVYVFALLLINQIIVIWVEGVVGRPTPLAFVLGAPLVGALIWPWVFIILRDIRRKARLMG